MGRLDTVSSITAWTPSEKSKNSVTPRVEALTLCTKRKLIYYKKGTLEWKTIR